MDWAVAFASLGAGLTALAAAALAIRRRRTAERLRADLDAARSRAALFEAILDRIHDAVLVRDTDGSPLYANRRYRRLFAPAPETVAPFAGALDAEGAARWARQSAESLSSRSPVEDVEYRARRADGGVLIVECTASPLDSGGLPLGLLAAIRDVTQQRLVETSQRALARRLEFFVGAMPLGCILWDLDFTVQEWNDAAESIFGWSAAEATGRRYSELLAESPGDPVEAAWADPRGRPGVGRQVCRNRSKSGRAVDCEWFHTALVDDAGEVVAVASMVQDISERISLQRQLVQSQKMEAVGTLAGGIAHDFNNLLTAILGNLGLAGMRLGPSHPVAQGLLEAERAAERAAELTEQLLRFSRKSPSEMRPVRLEARLSETVELFRHATPADVRVQTDFAADFWETVADAGEIGQVVLNLCLNARDAVGESGTIAVSMRNRTLTPSDCEGRPWARPGDYVELSVADDGPGMDASVRERIFEPFFTTKPVGKGTGLGLATAYGIVEEHGGGIEVESAPGQGATFRVLLPRYRPDLDSAPPRGLPPRSEPYTVLVADDEEAVRRLAGAILAAQGCSIVEARDGAEAIDEVLRLGEALDLAILDLAMPRRGGVRALAEIRRLRPELPVIVSTSQAFDGMPADSTRLLAKPYKPEQLLRAAHAALTPAGAGPSLG